MKFTIPSDPSALREVQTGILAEVDRHGFDAEFRFAVHLALEEGLINAMKHGNKYDASKKVHVEAKVTAKQVEILIEDEGPGFERHCVPDPRLTENLEKCCGRGLLLIESYMDIVEYSQDGRRVRMVKKK